MERRVPNPNPVTKDPDTRPSDQATAPQDGGQPSPFLFVYDFIFHRLISLCEATQQSVRLRPATVSPTHTTPPNIDYRSEYVSHLSLLVYIWSYILSSAPSDFFRSDSDDDAHYLINTNARLRDERPHAGSQLKRPGSPDTTQQAAMERPSGYEERELVGSEGQSSHRCASLTDVPTPDWLSITALRLQSPSNLVSQWLNFILSPQINRLSNHPIAPSQPQSDFCFTLHHALPERLSPC